MTSLYRLGTRKIPISNRCFAALLALAPGFASAQTRVTLDAAATITRFTAQDPALRVAEAQIARARAHLVGADAFARENPILSLSGGPRQVSSGEWLTDFIVSVSMPFDLSGVRSARRASADASVRLAEAAADELRQASRAEAMTLWLQCLVAEARVALTQRRLTTEEAAYRAVEVRLRHGGVAMGDLAISTVELALARGAVRSAEASRDELLSALRGHLALAPDAVIELSGSLSDEATAPPLDELLLRVQRRADLRRATLAATASRRNAEYQSRLGVPPLRVGLSGGRENEYYGRVGLDVALPLIQRNQTAVAVARAGIRVAEVERASLRTQAETELRAAFVAWAGGRRALEALEAGLPFAEQADRLAIRAYELGQRDVESTHAVFRQTHALRAAALDAAIAAAEARRRIDRATGGP